MNGKFTEESVGMFRKLVEGNDDSEEDNDKISEDGDNMHL